ncbi:hypothetical protein [Glycomyces paridis]|uniref:Uncharacterized protein n=1 Tax=Glycomyces paridis TaxID=2126555 RepID=A0A4S8P2H6_9ACTN|nr:hypothetical protein [Glycomyces paridis]THV24248.1 hypothetical protein E9998_21730 [Glycomyces paridis]
MMNAPGTADRIGRPASIAFWTAAPVLWLVSFFCWLAFAEPGTQSAKLLFIVLAAIPVPWLLWASWRMPRPRLDTYVAEGGALLTGFIAMYAVFLAFMLDESGPAPIGFTASFLAIAAVFIAAAWPLPGRRIVYGSAALAAATLAIGLRYLYSDENYHPGFESMTQDELLATVVFGLPALGIVLQIVWWLVSRNRTPKTAA